MYITQDYQPGDPQAVPPAGTCQRCRGEIYPGERVYRWEGRGLCPDCFKAVVSALLEASPALVAADLGVESRVLPGRRGGRGPWC